MRLIGSATNCRSSARPQENGLWQEIDTAKTSDSCIQYCQQNGSVSLGTRLHVGLIVRPIAGVATAMTFAADFAYFQNSCRPVHVSEVRSRLSCGNRGALSSFGPVLHELCPFPSIFACHGDEFLLLGQLALNSVDPVFPLQNARSWRSWSPAQLVHPPPVRASALKRLRQAPWDHKSLPTCQAADEPAQSQSGPAALNHNRLRGRHRRNTRETACPGLPLSRILAHVTCHE